MIQWMNEPDAEGPIKIVSAGITPLLMIFLGERRWTVSAAVHWVPELKRSLPHMSDGCRWCDYPATVKSWLPVQVCPLWQPEGIMHLGTLKHLPLSLVGEQTWPRKIFEVPASASMLLKHARPMIAFAVRRGSGKFHKKVCFQVFDNIVDGLFPPFDVRPWLLRSWGQCSKSGDELEGGVRS